MQWYSRAQEAINTALPTLAPTQATNLALLITAILKKQTLCLSELARAYPSPDKRRLSTPKHGLLHRLKGLWRFTDNHRIDAMGVQLAMVESTLGALGYPPTCWVWP